MAVFKKRGKWWIGYRRDGKWRREPVGASHALAKDVLAKRQAEAAEQKHFPGRVAQARVFNELADKYWELHGSHLLSKSWKWTFAKLKKSFGSRRVGDMTAADVQRFYNEIACERSYATANHYLTLLRSIFNKGTVWGDFYGVNPCNGVKRGREAHHRLRYLSADEIERLYRAAPVSLYPVLACALLTGMRRAELLDLAWENVSLEQSTIYILKAKSGMPREIPIPSKLKEVLIGLEPKTAGRVFDISLMTLRRYFARAVREAGIVGFRFHDLRHTFASHFIMQTRNQPALQNLLGHSGPAMTQRYAHLSRGHLASEIAAFESAIPTKAEEMPLALHQGLHRPEVRPLLRH